MSSNIGDPDPRRRGRPRGFDQRAALEAAMRLFWAQGYAAASIDVLCRAMHVPRASLYQGYGDKQGLFLAVVAHYVETRIGTVVAALDGGHDLATDVAGFFAAVIALATADAQTPGCLVSCVLADAAGANPRFRAELGARFEAIEARLADRLLRAQAEGDLAASADPMVLGGMLAALARGLMVRARAGSEAALLRPLAEAAIALVCRPPMPRLSARGQPRRRVALQP